MNAKHIDDATYNDALAAFEAGRTVTVSLTFYGQARRAVFTDGDDAVRRDKAYALLASLLRDQDGVDNVAVAVS